MPPDEEETTNQADRFDLGIDNVELRHETLSRDEQVRWCALQAAWQVTPGSINLGKTPESILADALVFEEYLRDGTVPQS